LCNDTSVPAKFPLENEDQRPEAAFAAFCWRAMKGLQTPHPVGAVKARGQWR